MSFRLCMGLLIPISFAGAPGGLPYHGWMNQGYRSKLTSSINNPQSEFINQNETGWLVQKGSFAIRHSPFAIRNSSFPAPRGASTADPEGGKYGSISQPVILPGSG